MNTLGPILSSHGLTALNPGFTVCVWGDESLGQLSRALFRFLLGRASASVSSSLFRLHSVLCLQTIQAHLRGLCHQLQESLIDYVSGIFFFRGACQHQLCINLLWKRARNTNKPCGRRSVMHPSKIPNGKRRKKQSCLAFTNRPAFNSFKSYLIVCNRVPSTITN